MSSRAALRIVSAVLLAAILGGCGGGAAGESEPHILVLSATGTATLESVEYLVEERTVREEPATLPWEKSFTLPSDTRQEWRVVIIHRDGDIRALATVNGQLVTRSAGAGDGTGTLTLSGSIDG